MPPSPFKVLTRTEIRTGRISIPAAVRDLLFAHLSENTKAEVTMVDEKGDSYEIVVKLRESRTKPEFLPKGGKKFVRKRNLQPYDVLVFSAGESPDYFRVRVEKSLRSPRLPPPAGSPETPPVGLGLSAPSPPPELTFLASGQYLISSDHSATSPIKAAALFAPSSPPGVGQLRQELSTAMAMSSMKAEKQEPELSLELTLVSPWALFLQDQHAMIKPNPSTELVLAPPVAAEFDF